MMARKKPLSTKEPVEGVNKTQMISFELPPPKTACKLIDEENANEVITLLHEEAKVL